MGDKITFFLASVLIIGILAYYIDTPVPDGFTQVWKIKLYLAFFKMVFMAPHLSVHMGFDLRDSFYDAFYLAGKIQANIEYQDPTINITETFFKKTFVTIYEPPEEEKTGRGIVYLHGGGWTVGQISFFDNQNRKLAKALGAVLVFVDYRLAYHHIFPAAFDDSLEATVYLIEHAKKFGVDPQRIAVMGDSAGGNLAAAVSYHMKTKKFSPLPKLQVLIYPVLQGHDLDTPSYRANKDGMFLTKASMAFFFSNYLVGADYERHMEDFYNNEHTSKDEKTEVGREFLSVNLLPKDDYMENYESEILDYKNKTLWMNIKDKLRDPRFAPIFAKNLTGVSPAYILTCQFDVLRDDGYFYAKRLKDAKVKTEHVNLHCFHAWNYLHQYVDMFDEFYNQMLTFIKENL